MYISSNFKCQLSFKQLSVTNIKLSNIILYFILKIQPIWILKFEDTKGVIRSCKSKKGRQHNDKKNKQWSTKHYTEN